MRVGMDAQVEPGAEVCIYTRDTEAKTIPIVYQDECVLVAVKPAGVSCEPDAKGGRTLTQLLHAQMLTNDPGAREPLLCHRLDNPTVGLILLAKSPVVQDTMQNAFREKDHPYIAYFQAFTNTYGDIGYLRKVYTTALCLEQVAGISIATRADCINDEVLTLLDSLKEEFPNKFIWVELGLQTIHPQTIKYIRRGYDMDVFYQSFQALQAHNLPTVIHVILGLPGESTDDMMQTIDYINKLHPFGVKLQLLHVLKNTDLATDYLDGKFETLTMEEYLELVVESICRLKNDIVIHRVTGDGPKDITIAPTWCFRKTKTLNTFHHMLWNRNLSQGCLYKEQ